MNTLTKSIQDVQESIKRDTSSMNTYAKKVEMGEKILTTLVARQQEEARELKLKLVKALPAKYHQFFGGQILSGVNLNREGKPRDYAGADILAEVEFMNEKLDPEVKIRVKTINGNLRWVNLATAQTQFMVKTVHNTVVEMR